MRTLKLTGSDNRMDCREMLYDPLNPLPAACTDCGFPDLDDVPQPYFLVKSRTMSPNELAPAEAGNFFVRERVRHVLEVVVPGELSFYPTCFKGTSEVTPWQLAVPRFQVVTAEVDPKISRCKTCGEPRSAHPGTQYKKWVWNGESDRDTLKSATWGSSENGWDRWISRDLFFSVRLLSLLKQIGAKGLDPTEKIPKLDDEEASWGDAQIQLLAERGIPLHAPGTLSGADAQWFREYQKKHAADLGSIDWKRIEKEGKVKLPKSYKDFMKSVGPCSFENIDEQEGFDVHILPPEELDFESFRAGKVTSEDDEVEPVDGVMFASTDHGDCFCFGIRKDRKEFEVFLYNHEMDAFEPYASDFAACVKRFAAD